MCLIYYETRVSGTRRIDLRKDTVDLVGDKMVNDDTYSDAYGHATNELSIRPASCLYFCNPLFAFHVVPVSC